MANLVTHDLSEVMQGDCSRPASSDDEQNTSEEMKFIQSVLDSMAAENLDVLSKEEIEELILEREKAAEAVLAIPLPVVP